MKLIVNGKKVNIVGIKTFGYVKDWKEYDIRNIIDRKYSKRIIRDVFKYNKEEILSKIKDIIIEKFENDKHIEFEEYKIEIVINYDYEIDFEKNKVLIKIERLSCFFWIGIGFGRSIYITNDEFSYDLDEKTKKDLIIAKVFIHL